MTSLMKQHLGSASIRMKAQADKGCSKRVLQVGDLVFLKLQPFFMFSPHYLFVLTKSWYSSSLAYSKCCERLDISVAYKLDLREHSSIHPVFHVSQLKQVVGGKCQVSTDMPLELSSVQVPQKVLKWSYAPESLATWENFEALHQRFPLVPT